METFIMETFIVCIIIIVLIIVFAILGCKLSSKLELKSQYEKPIPNNLLPATEEEKSLYVAYGTVVNARDSVTLGDGIQNIVRYATIKIDELQFEVELDDAILNDKVIVFYSKDDKEQMVYRFSIRKENTNETK